MNWRGIQASLLLVSCSTLANAAFGQTVVYPRPYDGIQAGVDAYRLAEEQRRAQLGAQLYLNDALGYRSFTPGAPGVTTYYRYPVVGYGAIQSPGVTYSSYSGVRGVFGQSTYSSSTTFYGPGGYYSTGGFYGANVGPSWNYPASPPVYRGYIYPTAPLVRQPIGRREVQTGPDRWESHPVYETPIPAYEVPYSRPLVEAGIPVERAPAFAPPPSDPVVVPRVERRRREF